ncbi:MAG: macro domain-containing protein [Chloroflexi bacterium]|nr:macro domain-containing protein [Chloroflexota bacterium]
MTDTNIEIIQGDITKQEVDAIVNAANNHLWMGAGTAGAIVRAGGREIEDEAIRQGPIGVGEAVVTGPGNLACQHVIHAAAMGQDLHTSADKIRSSTDNALKRAEELGVASIAFPALGTGVGGFDYEHAAQIMLEVCLSHSGGNRSLRTVRFVLFDQRAFEAFERVAQSVLSAAESHK